uniref:Uncharacterized protein n=1 Tax=Pan troglodytes TaxID=9598 RepID=A0A2I3RD30_PANTR
MAQYVVHIFELLIGKAEQLHRKQSSKQAVIFHLCVCVCVCVCVCLRLGLALLPRPECGGRISAHCSLDLLGLHILQPQPPR